MYYRVFTTSKSCMFLFLWLVFQCLSCADREMEEESFPEPEPEPVYEPVRVVDPDFDTSLGVVALLDNTGRESEDETAERNLYSAEHIVEVAGLPYVKTTNWQEAMDLGRMIVVASPISEKSIDGKELEAITGWIGKGGVLVAPAITATGSNILGLFGVSASASRKTRYGINFDSAHPELAYIDDEEERTVKLGSEKNGAVRSYGYSLAGGVALAGFDTGEACLVKHNTGSGSAYTFGMKWRDVIQRSQLNKDFGATRYYNNAMDPMGDMFPLIVRGIHSSTQPVSVWKHTVPGRYQSVLIPTHDCDSRTSYEEMHYMSKYERSLRLKAHYFLTVHYYRDSPYLSRFYDETSVEACKALLEDGHTVGSHSIGHFPDFSTTNRFPLDIVTEEEYSQRASHDPSTEITSGGSTWAEVVLSKRIIERDLGKEVRSFRTGHLCMNKNIPRAMEMGGYTLSSCYSSGDVLTCFPFRERLDNSWTGDFNGVLQIPLNISDVFSKDKMTDKNWQEKTAIWLDVLNKLSRNYAACVLLIHPNRYWKMKAQKMLVDNMDRNKIGLFNFEAYGDFWNARRAVDFRYSYIQEKKKVVIRAEREDIDRTSHLSFVIETSAEMPVEEAVLVDKEYQGIKLLLRRISDNRILASQR